VLNTADEFRMDPVMCILNGGEDYELLFTASPDTRVPQRIAGVRVTTIGRVIRGKSMFLVSEGKRRPLQPRGWEHFR